MQSQFPRLSTLFCLIILWVVSCKTTEPVIPKSADKIIAGFAFNSLTPAVTATVDGAAKTIMATVPFGTDVTKLVPTIVVSAKATVSPVSDMAQDFSKTVTYTVTAEDGTTQAYAVAVGVGAAPKSMAKDITAFAFSGLSPVVNCAIDGTTKVISATLPAGTDATKLIPTITLSPKATVSPATGVAQDFSKAVTYTVTAEDGTTQAYTATVTVAVPPFSGLVYVGSGSGLLVAVDAATGTKKWEFKAGASIQTTPTVVGGVLYIASWDKKLYALDALTGAKKWESNPASVVLSQPRACPMVANGILYFGGEIALYALDANTGAKKWEFVGDGIYGWEAAPTVVNGVVYASIRGSAFGKSGLRALDAATGAVKWHQPGIGISESSPAVVGGLLYAGSEGDGLKALDIATGAIRWTLDVGLVAESSPTVANGVVYIGTSSLGSSTANDKLWAVDAVTGLRKWDFRTPDGGPYSSSPIVAGGIAYIGAGGTLYAVDAASGTQKWATRPDGSGFIQSGPVVAEGVVYLGINKKLFAFDAATGTKKWEYDIGSGTAYSSPCVLAKDGTVYHAGISGMVQ